MDIIIQPNLSTCGPTAIYNSLVLEGRAKDVSVSRIKSECLCNYEGTSDKDMFRVIKKFWSNSIYYKKINLDIIDRSLSSGNKIIFGYDYLLGKKSMEGHFCLIYAKSKTHYRVSNFYWPSDAALINRRSKDKIIQRDIRIPIKKFNKMMKKEIISACGFIL